MYIYNILSMHTINRSLHIHQSKSFCLSNYKTTKLTMNISIRSLDVVVVGISFE